MIKLEATPVPVFEYAPRCLRIAGTRVALETVLYAFRQGSSPEQIVLDFTTLELPKVYAVLAWALAHPIEVDAYLQESEARAEEIRHRDAAQFPQNKLRDLVRARTGKSFMVLADEGFNSRIVRGLKQVVPDIDLVLVQEVGLVSTADPDILEWAANHRRAVLTYDVNTMTGFAWERIREGLPMAGLITVPALMPLCKAIFELVLIAQMTSAEKRQGTISHLPM